MRTMEEPAKKSRHRSPGAEEAATIRYIIDNPVRAGLVKHPAEYPFTGSMRYTMEELEQLALPADESKIPRWLAEEPWEVKRGFGAHEAGMSSG